MAIREQERLANLKKLSPLQAIQSLLDERGSSGEERYLIAAILRDRRIELDDDEISYVIHDARRQGIGAPEVFDRLLMVGDAAQAFAARPASAR